MRPSVRFCCRLGELPRFWDPSQCQRERCAQHCARLRSRPRAAASSGEDRQVDYVDDRLSFERSTATAKDAQGTPTQSHISPSILIFEDTHDHFTPCGEMHAALRETAEPSESCRVVCGGKGRLIKPPWSRAKGKYEVNLPQMPPL